ncbi:MAG TPA: KTSC domain-containing protein [Sphingobacteriaceae bacterium]
MKKYPVESSVMTSAGYDAETRILEVQFKNGGAVRQYYDVSQALFDDFMAAESAGDFFNLHINGKYPEKRVDR